MQRFEKRRLLSDQTGGVALILVIWVIVVLIAVVGEFSYSMRTEVNIARNFKEDIEAYQLALAGIEAAKAEILSVKDPSRMYVDGEGLLVLDPEAEEKPAREEELGKGIFRYIITDEDGRLNINAATPPQLKNIFLAAGVDNTDADAIVNSIMDWRDTDDLHMLNGAEEDYYQALPEPYSCKDGPMDSVEELLLVKGMTPDIFKGSKGGQDEKTYEGVVQYFTVMNTGVININTAPQAVLEAVLGIDAAKSILMQRETGPVAQAAGGKVASDFFTIVSTGAVSNGKIKRTVKTILQKKDNKMVSVYWNDNII